MTYPQARLKADIYRINKLLATEGPLPEAVGDDMLGRMEVVLHLSGWVVSLHEQLLWCANKEGVATGYHLYGAEAELLRYVFTDVFGDATESNQAYMRSTDDRIGQDCGMEPILEH